MQGVAVKQVKALKRDGGDDRECLDFGRCGIARKTACQERLGHRCCKSDTFFQQCGDLSQFRVCSSSDKDGLISAVGHARAGCCSAKAMPR